MELISDILRNNNEMMITLSSDEPEFTRSEDPFMGTKFGWFDKILLRNLLFSNERKEMNDFKDLANLEEKPLVQEHFDTNFRDILLSNMFEVLNLDLFQGSARDFMLYPASDVYGYSF